MSDERAMIGPDGEVRELDDADFAGFRRGAPWTRPGEVARLRRVEDAARAVLSAEDREAALDALRRALDALDALAD